MFKLFNAKEHLSQLDREKPSILTGGFYID